MTRDPDPFHRLLGPRTRPPGPFARLVATVAALALFALAFTVSVFVFLGLFALGALAWGWFWWKTRALRRQLRGELAAAARAGAAGGHGATIIEGEVLEVSEIEREPPR